MAEEQKYTRQEILEAYMDRATYMTTAEIIERSTKIIKDLFEKTNPLEELAEKIGWQIDTHSKKKFAEGIVIMKCTVESQYQNAKKMREKYPEIDFTTTIFKDIDKLKSEYDTQHKKLCEYLAFETKTEEEQK